MSSGGAQRQLGYLVNQLKEYNYKITVVIYNPKDDFYFFDSSINSIKVKRRSNGFSIKALKTIYQESKKNDIILSFSFAGNIYGAITKIFLPIKFIVCERSYYGAIRGLRGYLNRISYFVSDLIITNTIHHKLELIKNNYSPTRVKHIWNGYPIEDPIKLKIKKSTTRFIGVGRIIPNKGIHVLLDALEIFYKKNGFIPSFQWVGRIEDKEYKAMLDKRINLSQSLKSSWSWEGEQSNIKKYYSESDVLISCSFNEGLPNVICEAMLYGCFLIASKTGDNKKILGESRGLVFDVGSSESLCKKIEKYFSLSIEDRHNSKVNSQKFIIEELSIQKMVRQYDRVLEGI